MFQELLWEPSHPAGAGSTRAMSHPESLPWVAVPALHKRRVASRRGIKALRMLTQFC
jgi:hypothetical protein